MPSLAEGAASVTTQLSALLHAGVEHISSNQVITFTKYVKVILPMDGFVFWVKADLLSPSAIMNTSKLNGFGLNGAPRIITPAATYQARGSLHVMTEKIQDETEVYGTNRVIFTAEDPVHQDFNQVGPNVILIGSFEGLRFSFGNRKHYQQAGLDHYVGDAIYPMMETQIIDDLVDFDRRHVIVSNSLPIWLGLNGYEPLYGFGNPILMLYPSHLVQPNVRPPYGAVHIEPATTIALGGAPRLSRNSTHSQLMQDTVKITTYGMRNDAILDFLDCVLQYSLDYPDTLGIMNQPAPRDEKFNQNELGIIAQKKSIEFQVNYYQRRVNDIARQLIMSSIPDVILKDEFIVSAAA